MVHMGKADEAADLYAELAKRAPSVACHSTAELAKKARSLSQYEPIRLSLS